MVGSTDGMLGQFAAHVSVCQDRDNPINELERGVEQLLTAFSHRNQGRIPKRIIIYRDGVAENQFEDVISKELPAFKNAMMMRGYDEGYVKIAIVICQKRHHSRFVYENGARGNKAEGEPDYLNPCVGLCIDARSAQNNLDDPDSVGSITSPNLNEFYLNSHAAILGTSKPCKYSLVYDEIGLEVRFFMIRLLSLFLSLTIIFSSLLSYLDDRN
jgi:eukaryotic translation initiation factor 2C